MPAAIEITAERAMMASRQLPPRLASITALRTTAAMCTLAWFATCAHAAVIDANPSNYQNLVSSLAAGDTLRLAPGTYTQGLSLAGEAGTASRPIVISGPDDQSAVFTARDSSSIVQLDGTSYLRLQNLTLDGGARDGASGVESRGSSHDITLENLKIVGHGGNAQTAGISTQGAAWNWIIRHDTITGTGTGIRLGNADGSHPFVAGVIEYNLVLDTVGSNLEIAHQLARPTGIGLPVGDSRTIIRHNVFGKRSAASAHDGPHPSVLVGHLPLSGVGAGDLYEIYGNFFYQNPTAALLEAEGNLAVHDNLFVNAAGDAVNIQPLDDKPRNVIVYDNTVVATGLGLHISGGDTAYSQRLIANVSFAGSPISGPNQMSNVTGTYAAAADWLNAPFAAIGALDLFPKASRFGRAAVDLAAFRAFTDGTRDFNGRMHTGSRLSAYEGEGVNSGWRLALSIKPGTDEPAPSIALAADPVQVSAEGSSTLQWSVTDASSCTASDGWSGSKPPSGSETLGPITKDTTYSVTCTGPGGSAARSIQVAALSAAATPTVTMTASPGNVAAGGTSVISWTSTDTAGCSASGGWSGTKAPNGSESVGPLQSTMSFQLTCLGAGGNANDIVQVTVGGSTPPPMNPPPTNPPPPTSPPPTNPPPTNPPPTSPPMDPPPTSPPMDPPPTSPTTPPSVPPTTPATGDMKSGGGALDILMVACLALVTALRLRWSLRRT
jgi:hypothetical protein